MTDMRSIATVLMQSARPLPDVHAEPGPGVYAWFLVGASAIGEVSTSHEQPIYIGKSSNLAERTFYTHFTTGKTGFSTLRRSIGALLKDELGLHPVQRGAGPSKTNFTNYRFTGAGESDLTAWMLEHLHVGVNPRENPAPTERGLIATTRPPLNLTGWPNPNRLRIMELRKACADEARWPRPSAPERLVK